MYSERPPRNGQLFCYVRNLEVFLSLWISTVKWHWHFTSIWGWIRLFCLVPARSVIYVFFSIRCNLHCIIKKHTVENDYIIIRIHCNLKNSDRGVYNESVCCFFEITIKQNSHQGDYLRCVLLADSFPFSTYRGLCSPHITDWNHLCLVVCM